MDLHTPPSPILDPAAAVVVNPITPQAESWRETHSVRIDKPTIEPAEEIVAKHTALKLNGGLNRAYTIQSLCTAVPLMMVDVAVTGLSLLAVSYLANGGAVSPGTWLHLPALLFFQLGLLSLHQLYPGAGTSPVQELRGIVRSTLFAALCLCTVNLLFGQLSRSEFWVFVLTALVVGMLLPLARYCAREWLSRTSWWGIRTLLIGSIQDCKRVFARSNARRVCGLNLVGYVCQGDPSGSPESASAELLGNIDDAFAVASHRNAPVAALASVESQQAAYRLMFQFPSLVWLGSSVSAEDDNHLFDTYTKRLNMPFLRFVPRMCKRALDLVIVIPGLLVLAIPMALIALAIKLSSPGPVFYGPERIGQHGKMYRCWKFRSMVMNAEQVLKERLASDPKARAEWDRDTKLKSDPRIIPGVGHFIRRWSLDELPQLFNVLVGEMSLIGPRPIATYEIVRYQDHYYEYTQMLPGITGLWQVSGRNETTYETRVFLVHHYAANWSIWLDAWILAKTPIIVITRRGAY